MKTLDRYIIRLYLTNFAILFVVLVTLIIALDLIINIDEFVYLSREIEGGVWEKLGTTAAVTFDFYWPRIFLMYTYLVGLVQVAAAGFTLAALVRNRELTAMIAGGISLYRVAMPILIAGLMLTVVMFINRETIVAGYAEQYLVMQSDLKYGGRRSGALGFIADTRGSVFTAATLDLDRGVMTDVTILHRDALGRTTQRITAASATWNEAQGGWELDSGFGEARADQQALITAQSAQAFPVAFVATDLDPATLKIRREERLKEFLSLAQLSALMQKPELVDVKDLLRIIHGRFSLVVLNMLILTAGMSFFLLRGPGNLMVLSVQAAVVTLGTWGGGFVMLQMGAEGLPAAAVAWLPVVLAVPVATWYFDRVKS